MIIASSVEDARRRLIGKILEEGKPFPSRYGRAIQCRPALVVIKNPEYVEELDYSCWQICRESYFDRVEGLLDVAAERLRAKPYTRRISIPIWLPKDHLCETPPAITEVSFLYFNDRLNVTAFVRSLDALNYFTPDSDFLNYMLEEVSEKSGLEKGSIAMLISCPHIYERDVERAESEARKAEEIFGVTDEAAHLVEDYISSAWHSALEAVYHGKEKQTEWGEVFEGQQTSRFVPRLFVEVRKPEENQIHDKAPFTREYGVEYAHSYVIYANCIDKPVSEPILKEGEVYTYAERARYCENDEVKVDQLYMCMEKLREERCRRDCYVGISRPWDLTSDEPPCLRGYQLVCEIQNDCNRLAGIFYMRSNDIYGAMHANMFAFATLTEYVAELTDFSGCTYYHFANDAHIYGEFIDAVKEILYPETPAFWSHLTL
ncbi:thymidylate synthase [Archaeoglobus veneficus]|uniref:Thymidylate synthase n=1 Tax=Archaeoglobus veneficus (strain DSM 11195 / SNP6) TaxID=693661 RepID=F2KN27_ARCVS|nr:thymidylate synthase [Archaeoglobus veneficus]AEA47303.1 thymidylate synthase [Archaeoglobus veneficus SNP6]